MAGKFVVTDPDGNVSWDAETEGPECFGTESKAVARAKDLAESEPGKQVTVYKAISFVLADVSEPQVTAA